MEDSPPLSLFPLNVSSRPVGHFVIW
uniref:Uncharacterized protein n=1 Tax=Arundo donax TaxID=35708 RepID=A0A0A9BRM7_ARUDO